MTVNYVIIMEQSFLSLFTHFMRDSMKLNYRSQFIKESLVFLVKFFASDSLRPQQSSSKPIRVVFVSIFRSQRVNYFQGLSVVWLTRRNDKHLREIRVLTSGSYESTGRVCFARSLASTGLDYTSQLNTHHSQKLTLLPQSNIERASFPCS